MAFINTTSVHDAHGEVYAMYARQQQFWGYVPNYAKVFCHRPEVMSAWANLLAKIKNRVDHRTFELVTFAAARAIGSSSCSLAHGKVLSEQYFGRDAVRALARETDASDEISDADRALVRFARKVVRASSTVTQDDVDELKTLAFDDAQIFDIAAIAAARAFFANLIEALGARPDPAMANVPCDLLRVLAAGRAIDEAPSVSVAQPSIIDT